MSSFDSARFQSLLGTRLLGRDFTFLDSCGSTNQVARDTPSAAGRLVLAEHQNAGRGRWGRQWEDSAGDSLLMTLVLERPGSDHGAAYLAVAVGLGLAQACREACGADLKLKWPNDLLWQGRKAAGMLLESMDGGLLAVGIGINVNQEAGAFEGDLANSAASLSMAAGRPLDREALLAAILLAVEFQLDRLGREGFEPLKRDWHRLAAYLGDLVRVKVAGESGETLEGVVMGLDHDGSLLLRQDQGVILPVAAGDLLNLRPVLT